jgi:predicted transcriptional regulator
MKLIKEEKGKVYALGAKELSFEKVAMLNSDAVKRLLKVLDKAKYPKQLAKELNLHEQNVYYYIRKLESAGIIIPERTEMVQGTMAQYYKLAAPSFFFKVGDFKESSKVMVKESSYLSSFIQEGRLNAIIVVGSPDPHGPMKARSKDGYFGMDLALFLGSFLTYVPESHVRLDTEITEKEMKEHNLIVIGGPIVNKVSGELNKELPIYYNEEKRGVYSKLSKKLYVSEEVGYVNKIRHPMNSEKEVLLLAGMRNAGTKACILAFLKHFEELQKGNQYKAKTQSRVLEGVDLDSDGLVDDCEFLE